MHRFLFGTNVRKIIHFYLDNFSGFQWRVSDYSNFTNFLIDKERGGGHVTSTKWICGVHIGGGI